nr:26S proteasome non-ATPase regulatory subunit 14 [Polyrhizophydium stewartii]
MGRKPSQLRIAIDPDDKKYKRRASVSVGSALEQLLPKGRLTIRRVLIYVIIVVAAVFLINLIMFTPPTISELPKDAGSKHPASGVKAQGKASGAGAGAGAAGAAGAAASGAQPGMDTPTVDTAEMVYISSLALLKMLKHGRAGVPMEVMGLMLGEFIDEYTVRVIDVFAMPQSGTGVSVEAVDPVFQTKMLDMLKQTGRPEMVVGWYHSHPGFGCWLSSVDVNTQQSFEQLNQRAVAVVVDPIQSVKGKVVIDAFRLINTQAASAGVEPRQTTSNIGHLNKPSIHALIHGLNRHYYSIAINYRKNELEQKMLLNLHKKTWTHGLVLKDFDTHAEENAKAVQGMLALAEAYNKSVLEEMSLTSKQLETRHIGKQDPKRHLEDSVESSMSSNIVQCLGSMLDAVSF